MKCFRFAKFFVSFMVFNESILTCHWHCKT